MQRPRTPLNVTGSDCCKDVCKDAREHRRAVHDLNQLCREHRYNGDRAKNLANLTATRMNRAEFAAFHGKRAVQLGTGPMRDWHDDERKYNNNKYVRAVRDIAVATRFGAQHKRIINGHAERIAELSPSIQKQLCARSAKGQTHNECCANYLEAVSEFGTQPIANHRALPLFTGERPYDDQVYNGKRRQNFNEVIGIHEAKASTATNHLQQAGHMQTAAAYKAMREGMPQYVRNPGTPAGDPVNYNRPAMRPFESSRHPEAVEDGYEYEEMGIVP
jgi:hypothetical protein